MKKMWKGQRGFSLIELLVAIPIAALISAAATGAIFQIFASDRAGNDIIAFRQVQTAGGWLSNDALQAQNVDDTWEQPDDRGFPLTLTWTDWDNDIHQVVYDFIDMPSGTLKQLQRQETVDGDSSTRIVGQYLDESASQVSYDASAYNLIFEVTATVAEQTASRVYEVKPRPLS
jgi:prepilin-type N-terminal cleavage/methylation domain-containing protein